MNRHMIDYNAIPAPYVAMTSEPAKTPSQIAADLAEARRQAQAADAKAYESMKAPAAPTPREAPYRPAEFDFAYVNSKGQSGEVIPKRPEPAALRAPVDPLDALADRVVNDEDMYQRLRDHRGGCSCHISPPCGACSNPLTLGEAEALGWLEEDTPAAAPTEWRDGRPSAVGWWQVKRADGFDDGFDFGFCAAYWSGSRYTRFSVRDSAKDYSADLVSMYPDQESKATWLKPAGEFRALWRGPRLTGADWPEPSAS